MKEKSEELKQRTKNFALKMIKLYRSLPHGKDCDVIGYQMLKCATSVGANYRAACRARSNATLYQKLHLLKKKPMNVVTGWN